MTKTAKTQISDIFNEQTRELTLACGHIRKLDIVSELILATNEDPEAILKSWHDRKCCYCRESDLISEMSKRGHYIGHLEGWDEDEDACDVTEEERRKATIRRNDFIELLLQFEDLDAGSYQRELEEYVEEFVLTLKHYWWIQWWTEYSVMRNDQIRTMENAIRDLGTC